MSKAVLVLDMPESCSKCTMVTGCDYCILQDEDSNFRADSWNDLRANCPLRELPEKKEASKYMNEKEKGYCEGWNACIDAITGGEE